jgi:fructan beta-fructosidase
LSGVPFLKLSKTYSMKLLTVSVTVLAFFFFQSCRNASESSAKSTLTVKDSLNSDKPLFHYGPKKNWINDPNCLVFNNGTYHLFYQYNPFADVWGHMTWGHATSTDLMHWTEQPVAIPEFTEHDSVATSIFSGTAFIDSFNTSGLGNDANSSPMIAIYTGNVTVGVKQIAQYQNLAYSNDNGQTFTQYKGNPVLDIHSKEFRDPKVFWYAPAKQWIMIVSKPDEYKVHFYGSTNLREWKKVGEFGGNIGNRAKVWECPDMFELPVENSTEKKWVITVSAGHPQEGFLSMQYFVGNFDGKKFTADPLPYPLYMDFGKDIYAGITYNDLPASQNRTVMIGWINCWEYANVIPSTGYRGRMSVPRKLSLIKNSSGFYQLMQQPVKEFDALKKEVFSANDQQVDSVLNLSFHGNTYEIDVTIESSASTAEGIKILKSKSEETVLKYNNSNKILSLDRRKSGNVNFSPKFSSVETVAAAPQNGIVNLRILVDKKIVTVFVNKGQSVITDQVFPLENEGGIQLFSEGGKSVFKSVKIYTIDM